MPHVQVTIAGRSYRMACGEGEEEHLTLLANRLDDKVAAMRAGFGEIGDMRLHVMAALTLADEAAEAARRTAALEGELAVLRSEMDAAAVRALAAERQIADALVASAERIERLAEAIAAPRGAPDRP